MMTDEQRPEAARRATRHATLAILAADGDVPVRAEVAGNPAMEKVQPATPEEARAAFAAVAAEVSQLRRLSLAELEEKHTQLLGVASSVRSRDALIKRISLALQRRAGSR